MAGDNNCDHEADEFAEPEVTSSHATKRKGTVRGRGPSKKIQSLVPMYLEFDEKNRPTGQWEKQYGQHLGNCAKMIDITIQGWEYVSDVVKDSMWEQTKQQFHIEEDPNLERKKNFLSGVGNRWRVFKSWLVDRFIERTAAPSENSPNANLKPWELYEGYISEEQWKIFEAYVASDAFKEKSKKGKANAAGNIHRHTMGQKSYSRKRQDWIKEKRLPNPDGGSSREGSSMVIDTIANRPLEWVLGHQKRTKDGKWEVDPNKPETVRVVSLVLENLEKEAKEKKDGRTPHSERGVDALTKALGKKDHRGYVKGFGRCGVGVGHQKAWGKVDRRMKRAGGCSYKGIESIRAAITQEVEEKFDQKLQERVAIEVQAYLASQLNFSKPKDTPLPNVKDQGTSLIEVMTKCRLAVNDEFNDGNLVVVAEGTIYPTTSEAMRNSQTILPGHYKVSVDKAYAEHGKIDLPVRSPDGATKLSEVENGFVQWPMSLVLFEDKVTHSPNGKFKSMSQNEEQVASCDRRSEGSTCVGFEALVGDDVLAHLTEECELLFYRMCDGNHDTTSISLKASSLYLDEDKESWVTSNDISEFLRGSCANVSLIHVYIMYLVEHFVSLFDNSKIMFMCPQRISGVEIKRNVSEVKGYVKRAFISEHKRTPHCKFILAPYVQDKHWVLLVIDLGLGIAFEFDSIAQPIEHARPLLCAPVFNYAYKMYRSCLKGNAQKRSNPKLVFKQIECAQQLGGTECGYYVMRYMYEIVKYHNDCRGNLKEEYMGRSAAYNDMEMNEIREQWAKYFRTTFLLT